MSTTYNSATELAQALQRAAAAHGEHEKEIGRADPDWPTWYAEYMVQEQSKEDSDQPAPSEGRDHLKHLPERIDPNDLIASHPTNPPRDPEGGRDTDQDFMLRYGGGA